jgi:hypothetical protein
LIINDTSRQVGEDLMNLLKAITVLVLSTVILTACGSTKKETVTVTSDMKPTLDLSVDVSGQTATIHFKTDLHISPEHYGKERVPGEGHMHLFVDDGEKKVVTEDKTVLKDLSVGKHNLKVSLHNNDHTPYNVSQTIDFEVK